MRKREKLVHGMGINDSVGPISRLASDGRNVLCPYYNKWQSMLMRCYNKKFLSRQETYIGCTVCNEWLTFSTFKKWMKSQSWQGKELDKDILIPNNKVYSPDTCVFIDRRTNLLLVDSAKTRGKYPVGVSKSKGRYQARFRNGKEQVYIGMYGTEEEAHKAYINEKSRVIYMTAKHHPDNRVADALKRRAINMIAGR